jgi:hypothetical protein
MATYNPEIHTGDALLNYYDDYDYAGYKVFAGHKADPLCERFAYTGSDKNAGRETLQNAINAILSNPENTNIYLLQLIEVKGKKIEPKNAITFQLNKRQSYQPYQVPGHSIQEFNSLRSEIAALKAKLEEEYDEEDEESDNDNFLSGLLKSPELKSALISGIQALVMPRGKISAVAGVVSEEITQDQKIEKAIEVLKNYDDCLGDDLLMLCQMAMNNPEQFNFLITMLRK